MSRVDSSGFITPPPGLVPPRHDTDTHTERVPPRTPLPVFRPPSPLSTPVPTPATPVWLLSLPTGARVPIDGALLVGRNPVRFDRWSDAELLAVADPARSVSKTHAVFEAQGDVVRVTDLHSTNGVTLLDASGAESALPAGAAITLGAGSVVKLGEFRLQILSA